MATAKDIHVAPISSTDANALIRRVHYSGKVTNNSQLHLGVFLGGHLEGVMQFGPSLDKRKLIGLVAGTSWNEFIELNRMAFGPRLPRNSESRALGVAFRIIRKNYPHLRWVVSFADATQCGDGAIYRASGFVLTQINHRSEMMRLPSGEVIHRIAANTNQKIVASGGGGMMGLLKRAVSLGAIPLSGFQLRYVYFLDPSARARLTVPIIPFSEIGKRGARMYLGKRVGSDTVDTSAVQAGEGGLTPTPTLQHREVA
jgi:hypothetical protein